MSSYTLNSFPCQKESKYSIPSYATTFIETRNEQKRLNQLCKEKKELQQTLKQIMNHGEYLRKIRSIFQKLTPQSVYYQDIKQEFIKAKEKVNKNEKKYKEIIDRINENEIAINIISVKINNKIKPVNTKNEILNIGKMLDSIFDQAITDTFKIEIKEKENPELIKLFKNNEFKKIDQLTIEQWESREWIEEDDDNLYNPQIKEKYIGPFTSNYICFVLGIDKEGILKAIRQMKKMDIQSLKKSLEQYKKEPKSRKTEKEYSVIEEAQMFLKTEYQTDIEW